MAPEVADSMPYNHKADVYSFGKFACTACKVASAMWNFLSLLTVNHASFMHRDDTVGAEYV